MLYYSFHRCMFLIERACQAVFFRHDADYAELFFLLVRTVPGVLSRSRASRSHESGWRASWFSECSVWI